MLNRDFRQDDFTHLPVQTEPFGFVVVACLHMLLCLQESHSQDSFIVPEDDSQDCAAEVCTLIFFSRILSTVPIRSLRDVFRGRRFADDDSMREELRRFSKEFYATGTQRLMQRWKNYVDNEGDFVKGQFELYKGCTHNIFKFHYNRDYSF